MSAPTDPLARARALLEAAQEPYAPCSEAAVDRWVAAVPRLGRLEGAVFAELLAVAEAARAACAQREVEGLVIESAAVQVGPLADSLDRLDAALRAHIDGAT